MYKVKKRNDDLEMFELSKIKSAITRTFEACGRNYQDSIVETLAIKSVANAEKKIKDNVLSVEDIQDSVESILMGYGYEDVSKAYILYRKQHEKARNAKNSVLDYKKTMDGYLKASDWRVKENSSISYSLGGLILGNSGAMTANYWLSEIYDDEIAKAHNNCDLHIHDLSMLSGYCFTGDTIVKSLDGKNRTFEQLVKDGVKELWVYSYDTDNNKVVIAKAENPRITRYVDELVEITLASGKKIRCTKDHPIMKRDGTYVKACDLKPNTSVMPLNISDNHTVRKVKTVELEENIPVYDLTVPIYHNFAVGGDIFVHNCAGWSLKTLIKEGFNGVAKKTSSSPAKHLSTLCNQMTNFLGCLQNEWSGAQAFNSVDTLLAPFVKAENLSYKEVKQCIQSLIFNLNTSSRWGSQPVFSNFTFDWNVPDDLSELNCIVGGKEVDFKYKDCKREMDMINRAFLEVMIEGDDDGKGFAYPIPTYSITKDFDWDEEVKNNQLLFEMTAKYGIPYFSNYINSDMKPSDIRSMCCRLRLSLRELRKKNGGFFGSGDNTGSIGVVTINMPRLAYLSSSKDDFYNRLTHLMDIAARSLKIKRTVIEQFFESGLYPYTKRYLKSLDDHFSTIGLIGMNECCLNAKWIDGDISGTQGYAFTKEVIDYMREKLADYQEQYGNLYNLEATPAEGVTRRFANHDKKDFPDIITAGDKTDGSPYYTNSSHLPVGYTDDIFEALDHQDDLQTKYTSGTVFHAFLGEKLPNWQSAMMLTRKIAENYKLPYFTFSPTYSICPEHGYITGEEWTCPHCGKPTEVYSRVTGYYRAVQNFNDGKAHEFKDRKEYKFDSNTLNTPTESECESCKTDFTELPTTDFEKESSVGDAVRSILADTRKPMLFTTATCPNCKMAKKFIADAKFDCDILLAEENQELVKLYEITSAPTLIVFDNGSPVKIQNVSNIRKFLDENK